MARGTARAGGGENQAQHTHPSTASTTASASSSSDTPEPIPQATERHHTWSDLCVSWGAQAVHELLETGRADHRLANKTGSTPLQVGVWRHVRGGSSWAACMGVPSQWWAEQLLMDLCPLCPCPSGVQAAELAEAHACVLLLQVSATGRQSQQT